MESAEGEEEATRLGQHRGQESQAGPPREAPQRSSADSEMQQVDPLRLVPSGFKMKNST